MRKVIGFLCSCPWIDERTVGVGEPVTLIYSDGTTERVVLSHPVVRKHFWWLANFRRIAGPMTDTRATYPALPFVTRATDCS